MQPTKNLTVIVPCFNPPPGWEVALAGRFCEFQKMVSGEFSEVRLIVVNDGSTQNFAPQNTELLANCLPGVRIISSPENRGKGAALRLGVAESESGFHLLTDADFPYALPSMAKLAKILKEKGGIAAGNRDEVYYRNVPFFRKMLSKCLRFFLRRVLRLPVTDSQCGLKGFDPAGRAVFLETQIDRFLFDLEFLMLASGRVAVTPVPVELRAGVVFSKVGWKILAVEGRNFLKLLLKRWLP